MLAGRERTADDFRNLFSSCGFALTRIIPAGSDFAVIGGSLVCFTTAGHGAVGATVAAY